MDKKYKLYVCSETHWDREWYAPFQFYRMRLVRLIDKLLGIMERNPDYRCFNLDGQTIVLQDYLEIKPEKREIIKKYVQEGRLLIGPWYILPDEFLVSGESTVRNFMIGHRIASEFGKVSRTGYLPDMFGHISQMPQILQGFGLDNAIFWRGLSGDGYKSELYWEASDGTRVLGIHLPDAYGYGNAARLADDVEGAVKQLKALKDELAAKATTKHLLLMNGTDHLDPRGDIPEIIHLANQAIADGEFVHSTFDEYVAAVKKDVKELRTIKGELRDTNRSKDSRYNFVLPNVLSARIYLKQLNEVAQTALERWAEPYSAIAWSLGNEYPSGFLWKAWEWLIQNHPHDSICGCSVDEVHAPMETRFQWATEIADNLTEKHFHAIASRINTSVLADDEVAIVVFNGLGWDVSDTITVDIDFPASDVNFKGLDLRSMDGARIPVSVESTKKMVVNKIYKERAPFCEEAFRVRASFYAEKIPAYGYRAYRARLLRKPNKFAPSSDPANVLENPYLKVEINPNGSLRIIDKSTGAVYDRCNYFENGGDCGDGYTYSYPPYDSVITTLGEKAQIALIHDGPALKRYRIDYDWKLPAGLTDDRKRRLEETVLCPVSVVVSLGVSSKRVGIETTIDNRAKDHRLRAVFPTGIETDYSYSEAQFDVVEHKIKIDEIDPEVWIEDQPRQYPQQSFVDLSDGKRGLAIINKGLPEYEVKDNKSRDICLTLIRAVGYLGSGRDAYTIISGAGPHIETPGSQVQRKLIFKYSIAPHKGTWEEAETWREAHQHNVGVRSLTVGRHGGELGAEGSFVKVEGKNVIISALKKSDRKDALILRVFNPSRSNSTGRVLAYRKIASAKLTDLNEGVKGDLRVEKDGTLRLDVPAKKITTIQMELGG